MAQPDLILTPFGANAPAGNIDVIPESLAPGDPPQKASWQGGFPPVTMIPLAAGGIPPRGQDFNGVLNAISKHTVFQEAGGFYKWSAEVVAKGGYEKDAIVLSDDGMALYQSAINSNTDNFNTNPSSIGVSWKLYSGISAQNQKADKTTQVTAGTGLTGGGTLGANVVLNVAYGSTEGTAAQGDDPRLSDAREWTAQTVSQAEAEDGTATTRRAWTAQRVRQAIVAWWNGVSTTWSRGFVSSASAAEARDTLGLGTAAVLNQVVSRDDTALNRVVVTGWLGLGASAMSLPGGDWNNATINGGIYNSNGGANAPGPGWWIGTYLRHDGANYGTQVAYAFSGAIPRVMYRNQAGGLWHPWVEGYHTGNISSAILNGAHPVGSHYIQFAESDGTFSSAKSPSTLFGGTWTLKYNTDSVFFRTEGTLAADGRSGGVQGDAIRNMTGSVMGVQRNNSTADGVFSFVAQGGGFLGSNAGSTDTIQFNASNTVPTASENRVINRLIRVWERTA